MAAPATFALIGHCGADSWSIANAVKRAAPHATVTSADDDQSAARLARSGAVLLINRVLDGRFSTSSGVELIASLAKEQPKPRMVLISNYADAQRAAVEAGATQGFGKSDLGSEKTVELLRALAATEEPAETPE